MESRRTIPIPRRWRTGHIKLDKRMIRKAYTAARTGMPYVIIGDLLGLGRTTWDEYKRIAADALALVQREELTPEQLEPHQINCIKLQEEVKRGHAERLGESINLIQQLTVGRQKLSTKTTTKKSLVKLGNGRHLTTFNPETGKAEPVIVEQTTTEETRTTEVNLTASTWFLERIDREHFGSDKRENVSDLDSDDMQALSEQRLDMMGTLTAKGTGGLDDDEDEPSISDDDGVNDDETALPF